MRLRLEESASHAGGGSHIEDSSPDGEEDSNHHSTSVPLHRHSSAMRTTSKRGRAPPIDPYTGENPRYALMIGFHLLSEQPSGMTGLRVSS